MSNFNLLLSLVILLNISFVSCERAINPFEENTPTYSIYGAIDIDSGVNTIRIRDITTPLLADSTQGIENLSVFFKSLESDDQIELFDTLINFNGNLTNNYVLNGALQPAKQYELELQSPLVDNARVVITTPGITNAGATPESSLGCNQDMRIYFDNVKHPEFVNVEVGVRYQNRDYWQPVRQVAEPEYVEGSNRMEMTMTVNNLLVDIFPPPNIPIGTERFQLPTVNCYDVDIYTLNFRYIHFGPDWGDFYGTRFYAFDFFDSESIENGLGFVGALRRGTFSLNYVRD